MRELGFMMSRYWYAHPLSNKSAKFCSNIIHHAIELFHKPTLEILYFWLKITAVSLHLDIGRVIRFINGIVSNY